MFCPHCGAQNPDHATFCQSCQAPMVGTAGASANVPVQAIPNYLVPSILSTLFCCLPFGIVAIIFAAQVNGKVQARDIEGALESSKKAKFWCMLSFGIGLVGGLIYLGFMVIGVAGETVVGN